jgi:hypothetical protein
MANRLAARRHSVPGQIRYLPNRVKLNSATFRFPQAMDAAGKDSAITRPAVVHLSSRD